MQLQWRFRSIRRSTVFSGFLMLLFALIANTVIIRIRLGNQIRHQALLNQSRQVLSELAQVELLIKDIEIVQFNLLYTDDPRYLTPYDELISQLRPHLDDLSQLTADNPSQRERTPVLRKLVEDKLRQISQTILLDQSGKTKEANAQILSNSVLNTTHQIHDVVDAMEKDEMSRQASRSALSQRSVGLTIASIYLTNLILLVGLILFAMHTHSEMNAREEDALELRKKQQKIFESQERLRLAQDVAGMGTFDVELPSGKQTWSARTFEIFGFAPHSRQPDSDELMRMVYPTDRSMMADSFGALATGKRLHAEYRIVRADGEVRWIEVSGRGIFDNTRTPTRYLGVAYDVTERKVAEDKLRRSEDQLRALTARLQTAIEEERMRIAQELHDQLGQALTCIKMDLDWIVRKYGATGESWIPMLHDAMGVVDNNIALVRRLSTELRPQLLDSMGLRAAIEWEMEQFQRRSGVRCLVQVTDDPLNLTNEKEIAIFRIFQEAMTNIARHSNAQNVWVDLEREEDEVILTIKDDGSGFSADLVEQMQSLGLLGMYERALVMRASFEVESKPGKGTTIMLHVPLDKAMIRVSENHENINR